VRSYERAVVIGSTPWELKTGSPNFRRVLSTWKCEVEAEHRTLPRDESVATSRLQ